METKTKIVIAVVLLALSAIGGYSWKKTYDKRRASQISTPKPETERPATAVPPSSTSTAPETLAQQATSSPAVTPSPVPPRTGRDESFPQLRP